MAGKSPSQMPFDMVSRDISMLQKLCRTVVYETLSLRTAQDIYRCRHVDVDVVKAYEDGNGPGPNPALLQYDYTAGGGSLWNDAVYDIMVRNIRETQTKDSCWAGLTVLDDDYLLTEVECVFNNLRSTWRLSMPRVDEDGNFETPEEAAARAFDMITNKDRRSRHDKRRKDVRATIVYLSLKFKILTKKLEIYAKEKDHRAHTCRSCDRGDGTPRLGVPRKAP